MGDENEVNGRQVGDADTGTAQAFKNEDPGGIVWIDDDVLTADLNQEAGMSDESNAEFLGFRGNRLMCNSGARGHRGVANKLTELFGFLAKSDLQHEGLNALIRRWQGYLRCGIRATRQSSEEAESGEGKVFNMAVQNIVEKAV